MKRHHHCYLIGLFILFLPYRLSALIDYLAVSGNPSSLNITTAIPGSPPDSVINQSTTYSIMTFGMGEKITGQLNTNMPSGVSLKITLQAPPRAVSQGAIALTTTPQTLVSSIPLMTGMTTGLSIRYQLSSSVNAGPISNRTVTVILTVG